MVPGAGRPVAARGRGSRNVAVRGAGETLNTATIVAALIALLDALIMVAHQSRLRSAELACLGANRQRYRSPTGWCRQAMESFSKNASRRGSPASCPL
jgi:cytidine deaminase